MEFFKINKGIYIIILKNFYMEPILEDFHFIFYLLLYVIYLFKHSPRWSECVLGASDNLFTVSRLTVITDDLRSLALVLRLGVDCNYVFPQSVLMSICSLQRIFQLNYDALSYKAWLNLFLPCIIGSLFCYMDLNIDLDHFQKWLT